MRLLLENLPPSLPPSLAPQRETLARCLEAMNRALPLREVWLFGSHARGEARPDSDVDLCIVAEGAEAQLKTAQQLSRAIRFIRPKPSFTLVPITPARLAEKQSIHDYFLRRSSTRESALPRKTDVAGRRAGPRRGTGSAVALTA